MLCHHKMVLFSFLSDMYNQASILSKPVETQQKASGMWGAHHVDSLR